MVQTSFHALSSAVRVSASPGLLSPGWFCLLLRRLGRGSPLAGRSFVSRRCRVASGSGVIRILDPWRIALTKSQRVTLEASEEGTRATPPQSSHQEPGTCMLRPGSNKSRWPSKAPTTSSGHVGCIHDLEALGFPKHSQVVAKAGQFIIVWSEVPDAKSHCSPPSRLGVSPDRRSRHR